jgi:flagellar secretion chaperone FliS
MSLPTHRPYLEVEVLTAGPARLVEILFDLFLGTIRNARECCRNDDIVGRGRFVTKAVEILVELSTTLNFEVGELAINYARLYDYCQRRLLQAHVEQSEEMLQEVQSLIGELREAWQVVVAGAAVRCLSDAEIDAAQSAMHSSETRFSCLG